MKYVLEGCVDSLESARAVIEGGATRIELNSNVVIGGTTPSPELFRQIRLESEIPMRAMIRPRFGDFCYTDSEFDIMRYSVEECQKMRANGVVFGILKPDGTLDMKRMEILCRDADGMKLVLHRAFDVTRDAWESLEQVQELKMHTILTSGQKPDVLSGRECIAELIKKAQGIEILAGAGVSADNIAAIYAETGCTSYHMSAKEVHDSPMKFRRKEVSMGLPSLSEFERWQSSTEKFIAARKVLESL